MNSQSGKKAGLYLHVPFCQSKCAYCDFYSYAGAEPEKSGYAADLGKALAAFSGMARGVTFDSVYFGGGTPSLLDNSSLSALLRAVFAYYEVEEGAEITLEANPGTVDDGRWQGLFSMGFNRLSLGMQSALDGELAALGRVHTHADTVRAVSGARAAGFSNIALDLMLGIPGQTESSLRQSLDAQLSLAPAHASAYLLKREEGTPFYNRYPNGQGLPGEEEQAAFYLQTCAFFKQNGFWQEEISNFARPGFESVHNQKYWTLLPYLGLGPGAYSDFGGSRRFFPADTNAFRRAVSEGGLPLQWKTEDEAPDRLSETVFLSLRTGAGLSKAALCAVSDDGDAAFEKITAAFAPFLQKGLARLEGGALALTPEGFLLSNTLMTQALSAIE